MKSHVSDQLELATRIYRDSVARCTADVSDLRDLLTIRSRVEDEGLSFLTISLPNFCKDFERSLAIGKIETTCFSGWRRIPLSREARIRTGRKHGGIPTFLSGFLAQIFDRETGEVYEQFPRNTDSDPSHVYVGAVRQICLSFKKLALDCTPERVESAIEDFVHTEHSFAEFKPLAYQLDLFDRASRLIWSDVLVGINLSELQPKHGPGATAERVSGNGKYRWQWWHERLEPYFPFIDNCYSISSYDSKEFEEVTFLPEDKEIPVRVSPVPKTQKGPRIIAIEPACNQYAQQALRAVLYERIENSRLAGGHVNFTDQSINQAIALMASKTGQYATIDLSEASDRVPLELATRMLDANPEFRDAVLACRSSHAELPNGTIIGPLRKFASMGSALCFPIESMYFYTICVVALCRAQNLPVTFSSIDKVKEDVFVYGDDIIVPSRHAEIVLDYLQQYNCKVNLAKSFWNGKFRESCGQDAYDGESVTPIYVRRLHPKNKRQVSELISFVQGANAFYKRGYWQTASYMFEHVEKILGPLPYVSETSPGLGRISYLGYRSVERWNERLHRFEVKAWTPIPVYRTDPLEGYAALQKSLSSLSGRLDDWEARDERHLEQSAQYGAVALKRRWVQSS